MSGSRKYLPLPHAGSLEKFPSGFQPDKAKLASLEGEGSNQSNEPSSGGSLSIFWNSIIMMMIIRIIMITIMIIIMTL